MKGYRKILIAANGSVKVLEKGLQLAQDEKCWVTVVKVIPPYEGDLNLIGIRNIDDVLKSNGQSAISTIKNIADSAGALIKTRVEEGPADRKIVEVAEEEECDLIIIGARKRHWLRKFVGDNVVENVINQSPCPVLVVNT